MTYHHQWLWLVDTNGWAYELFSGARTAAYLSGSPELGCGKVFDVLNFGGCEAYPYAPPCNDTGDWEVQTFSTPAADDAPWYSASHPASTEALGFWIEEWTGLDSGHVKRAVAPIAKTPGGGTFGRTHAAERVMKFNVLLLGTSERSLEYLFRWLDATLTGVCSSCEQDSIMLRRYCPPGPLSNPPTDDELWDGVVLLRDVGLVEGLTWESEPVEDAGCFIRRVSFTLAAGDPCMYASSVEIVSDALLDLQDCMAADSTLFRLDFDDCAPGCGKLSSDCRAVFTFAPDVTGAATPILTIHNDDTSNPLPELSVRFYADTQGVGPQAACGLPMLGELHTHRLPPSSALVYDVAARRILYQDGGLADPIDGWAFIRNNEVGIPRFFALPCTTIYAIVELDSRCYVPTGTPGSSPWTDFITIFTPGPARIGLSMVERFGCP